MALASKETQILATSAVCAALYAVAKVLTNFIPTPWGVGQFAPGVVVPAVFAVLSGPMVAGIGAGIGVFIGDLFLPTTTPLLSLIAGVPGNFIGFYLFGYILQKAKSWRSFTWASLFSLTVGNLIAAVMVVMYLNATQFSWSLDLQIATTIGLMLFWLVTMLPFVLALVPLFARAASRSFGSATLFLQEPTWRVPSTRLLLLDSVVVALLFVAVLAISLFTPYGDLIFAATGMDEGGIFVLKMVLLAVAGTVVVFGPIVGLLGQPERVEDR